MPTRTTPTIKPDDIMDAGEVADAYGVSRPSVRIAMTRPDKYPSLAAKLPPPLRMIGSAWVWRRADIVKAIKDAARIEANVAKAKAGK